MAEILVQTHDRVTFPAGSDRRLIFTVEQVPDLNGLLAAVWLLIPGYANAQGRTLNLGDGTPVITKTLAAGDISVLDPGNKVIAVDLAALDTAPAGQPQVTGDFYDVLKLKLASGKQDEVSKGSYRILPSPHAVL